MISYLEGKLLKKKDDRVVILTHGVGYDVLLPPMVRESFNDKRAGSDGDDVSLHIFYYHPERQPRPTLVGFTNEAEKEFFELFTTVSDIGPMKATRLISVPISQIAQAIEDRNPRFLTQIKGLGPKIADKIIAHLYGKVGKYALLRGEKAVSTLKYPKSLPSRCLMLWSNSLGTSGRRRSSLSMKLWIEIPRPRLLKNCLKKCIGAKKSSYTLTVVR